MVNAIVQKMKSGGRLFYIGAGTSGRLGIVDASECPPTYGVEHSLLEIPITIGELSKLEHLELFDNNILKIPFEITKLKNLKYLGISLSFISDSAIKNLRLKMPQTKIE